MARTSGDVTAVICTLNEEATLPEVIDSVRPFVDVVMVMDGHSTDRTPEIARERGVRYELDNRRGKGAAIRQAIETVETGNVVFIDADGSHVAEDIPKLVAPMRRTWSSAAGCGVGATSSPVTGAASSASPVRTC